MRCTYALVAVVRFKQSAYRTREGVGLMHSTLEMSKKVAYEVIIKVKDVSGTATGESCMYLSYVHV